MNRSGTPPSTPESGATRPASARESPPEGQDSAPHWIQACLGVMQRLPGWKERALAGDVEWLKDLRERFPGVELLGEAKDRLTWVLDTIENGKRKGKPWNHRSGFTNWVKRTAQDNRRRDMLVGPDGRNMALPADVKR